MTRPYTWPAIGAVRLDGPPGPDPPPHPGNGTRQPPVWPVIDPISLQGLPVPPRRWIVQDWLPAGAVTLLSGDGGTGKSLLGMQLQTAAAIARDWLGLSVMPCRSLGYYCEDADDELWRRQADINAAYGCAFGDLEAVRWLPRAGLETGLMQFIDDRGHRTPVFDLLAKEAAGFGAQLVVIDTAADVFLGNENIRAQVRRFVQELTGLARAIDGAVLLLSHPSLTGLSTGSGLSGSTAWNNTVRSRMYLTRPEADSDEPASATADLRVLSRRKGNYARPDDEIGLRWAAGVFVRDSQPVGDMVAAIERDNRERAAETAFLAALDKLTEQGRNISHSPTATNYAPKAMAKLPEVSGYRKSDLAAAMARLFDRGEIVANAPIGRNASRHRAFGIAKNTQQGAISPTEAIRGQIRMP